MSTTLGSVKRSSCVGEPVGVEDGEHADDDHRQLQGDVGEGEDGEPALAAAAGDVERVEHAGGDDHQRSRSPISQPGRAKSAEIGSR